MSRRRAGELVATAARTAAAGDLDVAERLIEDAIAEAPRLAEAHDLHARILEARGGAGGGSAALGALARAIVLKRAPERIARFAELAEHYAPPKHEPALAGALLAAFAADGIEWQRLMPMAIRVWREGRRIAAPDPKALPALARDPLLAAILAKGIVTDPALEAWLVAWRRWLLQQVPLRGPALDFAGRIAIQAFQNEYVWPTGEAERDAVARIAAGLGDPPAPAKLIALALYRPLAALDPLPDSRRGPLRALIQVTVAPVREEAAAIESIPVLGTIDDETSRRVREQYEQSPYPRWQSLRRLAPGSLRATLRAYRPPDAAADRFDGPLAVLIAGCGTGQHALVSALGYGPDATVMGIDLSRASLVQAVVGARRLGIDNIAFAQLDLLQAPRLRRRFDVIECAGVLHHLADPLAGWRALRDVLRPDGMMLIGLYSGAARADVAAARALIAQRGLAEDADAIRGFRQQVLAGEDDWCRAIRRYPDFYSLSACRDLLFHRQEQTFSLPEIAAALAALDLEFLGFEITDPRIEQGFRRANPAPQAARDLAAWQAFEARHPRAFRGMYQFWCAPAQAAA